MPDLSEYSRKWRLASHTWPIAAAALLGVAVAVSAWFAVSVWEQRLARAKFNGIAGNYASILQNGLDDFLANITALRAFADAGLLHRDCRADRSHLAAGTMDFRFGLPTAQALASRGDCAGGAFDQRLGRAAQERRRA